MAKTEGRSFRQPSICLLLFFALTGCGDPQLEGGANGIPEQPGLVRDPYEDARKKVIGRTFDPLTLGSQKFEYARVIDIDDDAIVLLSKGKVIRVHWNSVPTEVKERWGFDPLAYRAPATEKPKEAVIPSENEKSLDEKNEMIERQEELIEAIVAEIASRKEQIGNLQQDLIALDAQYRREEADKRRVRATRMDDTPYNDRIGGVATSKADREIAKKKVEEEISEHERVLRILDKDLDSAEDRLVRMKEVVSEESAPQDPKFPQ